MAGATISADGCPRPARRARPKIQPLHHVVDDQRLHAVEARSAPAHFDQEIVEKARVWEVADGALLFTAGTCCGELGSSIPEASEIVR